MVEAIRQIKQSTLEQLKAKRVDIEIKRASLANVKYEEKKAHLLEESKKLDEALDATIKQKQAELNQELDKLRNEVKAKKEDYEKTARAQADAEAEAEVSHALRDFDIEIAKLEKDLA